jgi:hypothetical protein
MEHAPSIQLDRGGRWRHGAGVPEPRFLAVALAACSPAISAPQQPATSGQHTAPEQAVQAYLDRCDRLRSMGIDKVDLSDVSAQMVQQLAGFSDRYDVANLRRFPPAKRYAIVVCFLAEAQKTTLDHLVEMNRQFLTGLSRRARRAVEKHRRKSGSAPSGALPRCCRQWTSYWTKSDRPMCALPTCIARWTRRRCVKPLRPAAIFTS